MPSTSVMIKWLWVLSGCGQAFKWSMHQLLLRWRTDAKEQHPYQSQHNPKSTAGDCKGAAT